MTDVSDSTQDGADSGEAEVLETTTPQEVAEILGKSGMDVPVPKETEAAGDDDKTDETEDAAAKTGEAAKPDVPAVKETPKETAKSTADEQAAKEFSLTVEDKNGVTYKLNAGDNIDDVLAEFEPKSTAQVMQLMHDLGKLEAQKSDYEAEQAKVEEEAARDERVTQLQDSWKAEITDLQAAGRLDKTADGSSTRVDAVYAHMGEENAKRMQANRPGLSSFEDALNSLEIKEAKEAKEQAAKTAKETSRQNGALVGGSSAAATNAGPQYPGGARNANEALKAMKLI